MGEVKWRGRVKGNTQVPSLGTGFMVVPFTYRGTQEKV